MMSHDLHVRHVSLTHTPLNVVPFFFELRRKLPAVRSAKNLRQEREAFQCKLSQVGHHNAL